ncbi:hypothetical protein [Winogradskyella forsetii]|uniref:hypothetical protein n=1 Tax=Winogradskyella forsetii TaxID=2686077 RepID=UPI0015BA1F5F|nr:hypothetical protein [Winogradskyella forsetii]
MRIPIFIVLILIIFSCQSKKSEKTQNAELNTEAEIIKSENIILNDTVVYLSGDNDMALIKMTLVPNGTFDFYMSIYPEITLENEVETEAENDIINLNGTWSGNGETMSLRFANRKNDTLNLNDIFDVNYKDGNEFKVIDQNTVEIDYSLDKLNIWGISCYKTKN